MNTPSECSPWGVLLDLDGTLLDTEAAWLRAVASLLPNDVEGAALASRVEGESLQAAAGVIHARFGAGRTATEIEGELERAAFAEFDRGIAWQAGAHELVTELSTSAVPFALVTSSPRHWVEHFSTIVDLSAFREIVTVDDVTRAKPHPQPYELGAARIGLPTQRCVVIEDSDIGARAGIAAGCSVLVVRDISRDPFEEATRSLSSLHGVGLDALQQLVSRPQPSLSFASNPTSANPTPARRK